MQNSYSFYYWILIIYGGQKLKYYWTKALYSLAPIYWIVWLFSWNNFSAVASLINESSNFKSYRYFRGLGRAIGSGTSFSFYYYFESRVSHFRNFDFRFSSKLIILRMIYEEFYFEIFKMSFAPQFAPYSNPKF